MPPGRKRKYSPQTVLEWRKLYEEGQSLNQIAGAYGTVSSTVWYRLKDVGVMMRPPTMAVGTRTVKVSDEDLAETVRLYTKERLTMKQVGERLFLSVPAVSYRLRKAGIKTRTHADYKFSKRRNEAPHAEVAEAIFLYTRLGWSTEEIGERQGHVADTIARRLRIAGVTIRPRSEAIRLRFARRGRRAPSSRS